MANRAGPDERVPSGAVLSEYCLFSVHSPFNTNKNSMLELKSFIQQIFDILKSGRNKVTR